MVDEALQRQAWRLQPERTALIVIDVQNDFCARDGFYGRLGTDLTDAQAAALKLRAFIDVARGQGVLTVFVRTCYDPEYVSQAMVERYVRLGFPMRRTGDAAEDFCAAGSWGQEFYVVEPTSGDPIITKHRYSAFFETNMDTVLRANDIDALLLGGVATNVCVDSTLRDGYFRDYHVFLIEDCSGAYDRAMHDTTLRTVREAFGIVTTTREVQRVWERARSAT